MIKYTCRLTQLEKEKLEMKDWLEKRIKDYDNLAKAFKEVYDEEAESKKDPYDSKAYRLLREYSASKEAYKNCLDYYNNNTDIDELTAVTDENINLKNLVGYMYRCFKDKYDSNHTSNISTKTLVEFMENMFEKGNIEQW